MTAVAMPEEGAEIRRAGVRLPILVLGAYHPEQIDLIATWVCQGAENN